MLVLSRRPEQKFAFPELGVTVTLLNVRGNVVKVGIQAPSEIRVVRDEIGARSNGTGMKFAGAHFFSREQFHAFKNQLNTVSLCLKLYRRQLDAGLADEAERTLTRLEEQLQRFQIHFFESKAIEPARTTSHTCRTLLVEDDLNERELLAGILRMNGCHVATAGDGLEAMEYLESHPAPDLVLLDMCMPRCDGPQTIHSIREHPKWQSLKVFAVSATKPSQLGVSTGPGGIDRWFDKPLDTTALIREIRRSSEATSTAS